ncbi:Fic family protein [Dongia soli]|uniref:Fic family protein n=1 Tax=Dongia soli TaxID=600628 RepID=A0ABU5EG71_9PROT|nr:Fic family protein [Dongia soli]MDY0885415.1 Fic family protein [Dongia soli]
MATQALFLPYSLFNAIRDILSDLQPPIYHRGLFLEAIYYRDTDAIMLRADNAHFSDVALPFETSDSAALAFFPAGTVPCFWPRPLPEEKVLAFLDILKASVSDCAALSAHSRMAFLKKLGTAQSAPPMSRPSLPVPIDMSPRHRRIRGKAMILNNTLRHRLEAIDTKIEGYAAALYPTQLEEPIVRLSCHARYARRLIIKPGYASDLVAALIGETRHGDLIHNLILADGIADTTIRLYDRFDPHDVPFVQTRIFDEVANLRRVNSDARVLYLGPNWDRSWRLDDDLFPYPSQRPFSPFKVPPAAIEGAIAGYVDDFDEDRWTDIHPLIHAALSLVKFMEILPFAEANGRTARMLFGARLRRAGWPALPWEVLIERHYDRYQCLLRRALENREIDAFISFILQACELAIELGHEMLGVMVAKRLELTAALIMEGIEDEPAPRIAMDLLSGVLVNNVRRHGTPDSLLVPLAKLCDRGLLQIIGTPTGISYSVPAIRDLVSPLSKTPH